MCLIWVLVSYLRVGVNFGREVLMLGSIVHGWGYVLEDQEAITDVNTA